MKNILLILLIAIGFTSCYDESYLNPELEKKIAYFASSTDYTRTLVVGEGLNFKIGAAMAGTLSNTENRTVDFKVFQSGAAFEDPEDARVLMPTSHLETDLSGTVTAIIPKGKFLGMFDVKMDSVAFLSDILTLDGNYTLPIKIIASSLDSIGGLDSVNVSVTYIAGIDGYYLFDESVIKREIGGVILEDKTTTESFNSEEDKDTWRLATIAPFQVEATGATASFNKDLKFNITSQDDVVSLQSIDGQPVVEASGDNTYDASTGDFTLNFKYQKPEVDNDTIYHVSTKLVFRNRIRDGVNETREYLSYFRK